MDPVASVASAPVGASEDPSAHAPAVPVALPLGVPSDPEAGFRREQQAAQARFGLDIFLKNARPTPQPLLLMGPSTDPVVPLSLPMDNLEGF